MAHIALIPSSTNPPALQFIVNGHDFSHEVYRDVQLVEVGDDPLFSEVGLQVTFVVSRLDLGQTDDVPITDHFRKVAQRVRSMVDAGVSA